MASKVNPEPSGHTAIFPPATHQACKLETWAAASGKNAKTQPGGGNAAQNNTPAVDDDDAERWDGMS